MKGFQKLETRIVEENFDQASHDKFLKLKIFDWNFKEFSKILQQISLLFVVIYWTY